MVDIASFSDINADNPLPVSISAGGGSGSTVTIDQTTPGTTNAIVAMSVIALSGGQSQALAISGTSAQSAVINTGWAKVTPTVDCFWRADTNPTALANGSDDILLAGNTFRLTGITPGHKLAFITTGASGTVYITPGG